VLLMALMATRWWGKQRRLTKELRLQNMRFDTALDNMGSGLCMFDADKRLVVCNERYARLYRLPAELSKPGTSHAATIAHCVEQGVFKTGNGTGSAQQKLSESGTWPADAVIEELADGRLIRVTHQPMVGGGWVATHEDITERHQSEAKVAHMARHDVLTGLPNRAVLRERLDQAIKGTRDGDRQFVVHALDLDRFKEVNDALGHPVGDSLLKAVALRLRGCVRDTDTLARVGGDELCIIQCVSEPVSEAAALAGRIIETISGPFDLGDHHVTIGVSIGMAVAPTDGESPDRLLRSADLALYRAKSEGRNTYCFFEHEMDVRMQKRRALERDLRAALANDGLEVHYQPIVNLERNEICAMEALLRWNHRELGNIPPADFIPIAEETGLIIPIGEWVLRRACSDAAAWPKHVRVAVNLSAAQFKSRTLLHAVVGALARGEIGAHRLELEITESVMLEDAQGAFATLQQLRDLGVRIALDDFGTGYSSLSNLRRFPFDKIKIDRSFISDLSGANANAVALVRSMAQLGVSLGMSTTAEGVETREQLDGVRAHGCTEIQGYHVCRPVPAREIAQLFGTAPAGKTADAA